MFEVAPVPADLIAADDPRLREPSAEVTVFDTELVRPIEELVERMLATMIPARGLGLAAVQIGCPVRVIVVNDEGNLIAMVNPVLTRTLNRFVTMEERCLSLPGQWAAVSRPAKCEVAWVNMAGEPQARGFSGMSARIVQHEIDHINGVLITDPR